MIMIKKREIPYYISAKLGYGYKINSGIGDNAEILSWVTGRKLNGSIGGKFIAGVQFLYPNYPSVGLNFNAEIPMKKIQTEGYITDDYWSQGLNERPEIVNHDKSNRDLVGVIPVNRASGQLTAFYNLWLKENGLPYHYFKFEAGISYSEVVEYASFQYNKADYKISTENVSGLQTYKPNEFADWIYLKAEYRNQALHPFGFSGATVKSSDACYGLC